MKEKHIKSQYFSLYDCSDKKLITFMLENFHLEIICTFLELVLFVSILDITFEINGKTHSQLLSHPTCSNCTQLKVEIFKNKIKTAFIYTSQSDLGLKE